MTRILHTACRYLIPFSSDIAEGYEQEEQDNEPSCSCNPDLAENWYNADRIVDYYTAAEIGGYDDDDDDLPIH